MNERDLSVLISLHFVASALEHIVSIYTHGTAHWVIYTTLYKFLFYKHHSCFLPTHINIILLRHLTHIKRNQQPRDAVISRNRARDLHHLLLTEEALQLLE
jgi:hypothetical protein